MRMGSSSAVGVGGIGGMATTAAGGGAGTSRSRLSRASRKRLSPRRVGGRLLLLSAPAAMRVRVPSAGATTVVVVEDEEEAERKMGMAPLVSRRLRCAAGGGFSGVTRPLSCPLSRPLLLSSSSSCQAELRRGAAHP